MKNFKKLTIFSLFLLGSFALWGNVLAMTPTLSISNSGNNNVFITVNGDPNSSVTLYYYNSSYGYGMQNIMLGYTNYNGYFSTTLNTSNYNISQGSSVYVVVNSQQSSSVSWPYNNYYGGSSTNQHGLLVSSLNLSVGNSITLNSPTGSGLYVSNNSNPSVVGVNNVNTQNTILGCGGGAMYSTATGQYCYSYQNYNQNYNYTNTSSVTLTALASGSAMVTLCQSGNSNACSVVNIYVTGVVNTGSVLGSSTCGFYRTLRFGMSGSDVSCLKTLLANKGYLTAYDYSSYFDLQTKNAVMLFQQDNYLFIDGVVGRRTFNLLGN